MNWNNADIKSELEKEGWSLRQLSFSRGYKTNAAQTALHRPYPKMERIIADILGVRPDEIWPDRYIDGVPSRKSGRPIRAGE